MTMTVESTLISDDPVGGTEEWRCVKRVDVERIEWANPNSTDRIVADMVGWFFRTVELLPKGKHLYQHLYQN